MSALLGRIPSAVGYQPTLATDMGTMQERITTTKKGSITSVQAIYVPADDLTDPAPATTFAHLDATTVLSRGIAELGIYPAVDPLDSMSRILDPNIVGQEHYSVAKGVQKILQDYRSLQVRNRFYIYRPLDKPTCLCFIVNKCAIDGHSNLIITELININILNRSLFITLWNLEREKI